MNEIRLHTAIGPKGKQISSMLVRIPITKDNTKNPSRLAAVYDSRLLPMPAQGLMRDPVPTGSDEGALFNMTADCF
jgi:hypothetical protein|tara:strand:+ start:202 stop:429 length:228 start_codon:yes stop_codon:yes gene_type:complete